MEKGRSVDPREAFKDLKGYVRDGVLRRVIVEGQIPLSGPGSRSVDNGYKRKEFFEKTPDALSKNQRRQVGCNQRVKR